MLKFSSGRSLRTLLLLLALTGTVSLTGCSGTQALQFLTGGGPNVAANTQVGKNNQQTLGTSTVNGDQKITRPQARSIKQSQDSNKVQADKVETIVVNELPMWIVLLAIVGWLLPTPRDMILGFINIFRKKK